MSSFFWEIGNSNDGNPFFVISHGRVMLLWFGPGALDLARKCWTWLKSAGLGWEKFWTWVESAALSWKVLDLAQSAEFGPKSPGL